MKHIFIVNPYAGNMTFANNLRQQLEKIKDFEYFLFNSRYTGNETELTRKIVDFFPDEQLRIYACGGSGTLRNVLEGVGENPHVELASYPCGMTNDFLKVFCQEDRARFYDIAELINGETILVDSILTNHGRAINTFSCGMDAEIMRYIATQHPVRTVGIQIPYSAYIFEALLRLKKMDHMMIFVLIAGSYTPMCTIVLEGKAGLHLLVLIWGIAALGILFKAFWVTCPRWVSSVIYITMGWAALLAIGQIFHSMELAGFILLVVGGILYSMGGIIYALKIRELAPGFGAHEVFHLFVLAGSLCHYIMMLVYVA